MSVLDTVSQFVQRLISGAATGPVLRSTRSTGAQAAIVFVHGFGGDAAKTWGDFPTFLAGRASLAGWDLHSVGYPTSLRIDVPHIWAADPDLGILAKELATMLEHAPFARYRSLALVAHSMGGLIVQRMLLDSKVAARVSHVALFGTPSGGLRKADVGSWLKRQARDMAREGPFIASLRQRWRERFPSATPFALRVVAGDRDQFVPPESSLEPFADDVQRVVPGNHLEIVKPHDADSLSVAVVEELLLPAGAARGVVDSARLAVEQRRFTQAIGALLPHAGTIDEAALVQLALALESVGRGEEALRLLEGRYRQGTTSLDALGVLGGRLKRRWLVERAESDWTRARQLYQEGLTKAEAVGDADQAMYHAINLAFLDLMIAPVASAVPASAREMAQRALRHCATARPGVWRHATEAEANAILGDFPAARTCYERAVGAKPDSRESQSIYSQAILVVARVFGEAEQAQLEALFQPGPDARVGKNDPGAGKQR